MVELGNINARILSIYSKKSFVDSTASLSGDGEFGIILDKTSFYAESGGQEYDTGGIIIDGVAEFDVSNVQVFSGYVLHIGHLKYGTLKVGDEVVASYDEVRFIGTLCFTVMLILCSAPTMAPAKQPHRYAHTQLWPSRGAW